MAAQGCDLQLTAYAGANWRATFFVTGMTHSIVKRSAYEPTPWRAVQAGGVGDGQPSLNMPRAPRVDYLR